MPLPLPWRSAKFHRRRVAATPLLLYRTDRAIDMLADSYISSSTSAAFRRGRSLFLLLLLFFSVSLYCFLFYKANDDSLHLFDRFPFSSTSSLVDYNNPAQLPREYRLEKVLKDAAMEDRTVILTTLNEAWAAPNSILDIFLESFRIGNGTQTLLKHLVIIALDKKAFLRCVSAHTYCIALTTEGVDFSSEAYFMTPDYLKMMWRRIEFLVYVLEMGFNFIFTDADILWFRNPLPRFFSDADFQIACDHFLGDPYDTQNQPNGGFNFVKSNNRTIQFYKFWHSSRDTYPGYHDQDVLNFIKFDPFITDIGLKMRFLDTMYFGGLCEPSKDLNQVCTMHANCCYGMDSKINDLRIMLQVWKEYMSLPPRLKNTVTISWRVPDQCSLDSLQYGSPMKSVQ